MSIGILYDEGVVRIGRERRRQVDEKGVDA